MYFDNVYGDEKCKAISKLVDLVSPLIESKKLLSNLELLNSVEVLFTGWSGLKFDKHFLDAAPRLKVVFNESGSVKKCLSDEFWNRNIQITTAAASGNMVTIE